MADKTNVPKPNDDTIVTNFGEGTATKGGKPYTGIYVVKIKNSDNVSVSQYKNGKLVAAAPIVITPEGKAYKYTSNNVFVETKNPYATSTPSATPTPKATPKTEATPPPVAPSATPTPKATPSATPKVTPSAKPTPSVSTPPSGNKPTFDLGPSNGTTVDANYTVDVGFGLKDQAGNPLALAPIQIGPYIVSLAGTDPAAYKRVRSAIGSLTGRKTMDPNYVGGYVQKLATNIMASSDILARSGSLEDYIGKATQGTPGETKTPPQSYISSPTQAKSDINAIFKTELGREYN